MEGLGFPCVRCAAGGGFSVFSGQDGGAFSTTDCTVAGFARHGSTQMGGRRSVRAFSRKAIEIVRGRAAEDVRPYHVADQALRRSCRSGIEAKLPVRHWGEVAGQALRRKGRAWISVCSVVETDISRVGSVAKERGF